MIAIAYSTATFKGQSIKRIGVQKYADRIKNNGRVHKRHSSFYIGLYSQYWLHFMESSWENVTKLIKLNRID
ncbi:transposase [Nostoc linckia NIES-25]|nr:transposase [Nostoc linckia NIES-25]